MLAGMYVIVWHVFGYLTVLAEKNTVFGIF